MMTVVYALLGLLVLSLIGGCFVFIIKEYLSEHARRDKTDKKEYSV